MFPTVQIFVNGEPKGQPENWMPIPGYDGLYDVSSLGHVRRSADCIAKGNVVPLKVLRLTTQRNGYVTVELSRLGEAKKHLVHRLVASAFLGDVFGMQVNHKSGVKHDNSLGNLEITTAAENYHHAVDTGLAPLGARNGSVLHPESRPRGERNTQSKLKESDVLQIREMRNAGCTLKSIAARFGVCLQTVHNIVSGNGWRHV